MSRFHDSAIEYAERGFAVFPIKPKGKTPLTKHGVKDATTDKSMIDKWWTDHPDANVGIACGMASGGLLVIDLDEKPDGTSGIDSLKEWERSNGVTMPVTVSSITGGGGSHLLYKADTTEIKNGVGVLPGIDIRSDGGYIVAPPSVHESGRSYQWEYDPDEYEIAGADDTVINLVRSGKTKLSIKAAAINEELREGSRNDTLYRLACSLQSKGFDDEMILETITAVNNKQCRPPLSDNEIVKVVNSALKHDKGNITYQAGEIDLLTTYDKRSKTEKIRQCAENVARVILNDPALSGKIKYDTFSHRIIYMGQLSWREAGDTMGEWTDEDDSHLRNYLDICYNLRNKADYDDGFRMAYSVNNYNPLTGYLDALEWDGVSRIDKALTEYLGVEANQYNIMSFRIFLLGAIRRAYKPGCKFDYMPVLIGKQGDGKTTFFNLLACNDEWFDDNFNFRSLDSKTVIEKMDGKWILEMGEMDTLKKDSITADSMKAFITSKRDTYRTPFNKRPESRPRQCVFCGTSNDVNFLKDRTGNRRYLPIDTNKAQATRDIFDEATARPYFQQVIAEAVHDYKQDPDKPPVLPKDIEILAAARQSQHLEIDPWAVLIEDYLSTRYSGNRVNAARIWEDAFNKDPADMKRADATRILTILRHDIHGWHEMEGRQRVDARSSPTLCFERDNKLLPGFQELADDEEIPF